MARSLSSCSDVQQRQHRLRKDNAVNNANPEEGLLSVKDLARVLNCGRTMAWALVNTREIRDKNWPSRKDLARGS